MALISSYFKPAQEALDLPHPGTSQQGGEERLMILTMR
jgi:hypothetical protein